MRWTDEATTVFVKLYMKQECLWNPEHPEYKMKKSRDRAFSEIIESFSNAFKVSLKPAEARNKVKNLRTTYMQQVKIIIEKSTPDYIHPPTLVWFEEMDKYMKHIRPSRQNTTNPSKQVDSSPQSWDIKDIPNVTTNSFDTDPLIKNSDEEYTEEPTVKHLDTSLFSTRGNNNKFRRKRKLKEETHQDYENVQDEFEVYGKYVASQLRRMHIENAIRVQLRIQRLISETRLTELTDI